MRWREWQRGALDAKARRAHISPRFSALDGRWLRKELEESPGSTETWRRVTPAGGDPRDSATESKPPLRGAVRVKGCGKSAPRRWRQWRHGKPRQEQDQIGTAVTRFREPSGSVARGVWQQTSQRNGHPEGFSNDPLDKTRLTGALNQLN
jgi:hypothetical protein